jgi:hypothetical protein
MPSAGPYPDRVRLAAGGRVVLGDRRRGDPALPSELLAALQEWATVASTVQESGSADEQDLVRRRGRQLALRLSDLLGRPVDYVDPVTGTAEPVHAGPTEPVPRVNGHILATEPPEPTPWATGLPVAAFFAVLVALADVMLSSGFAEAFGLLWIPANLLVGLGLAPSLWLVRRTPFWRWPALGAAVGLVAAWVVLLLRMLG